MWNEIRGLNNHQFIHFPSHLSFHFISFQCIGNTLITTYTIFQFIILNTLANYMKGLQKRRMKEKITITKSIKIAIIFILNTFHHSLKIWCSIRIATSDNTIPKTSFTVDWNQNQSLAQTPSGRLYSQKPPFSPPVLEMLTKLKYFAVMPFSPYPIQ